MSNKELLIGGQAFGIGFRIADDLISSRTDEIIIQTTNFRSLMISLFRQFTTSLFFY